MVVRHLREQMDRAIVNGDGDRWRTLAREIEEIQSVPLKEYIEKYCSKPKGGKR